MDGKDKNSTWKLQGEEGFGEREKALREAVAKSATLDDLKIVLARYKDIIHRDTDYKVQNILYMLKEFLLKKISLADMPVQYGIKAKLSELVLKEAHFHKLNH